MPYVQEGESPDGTRRYVARDPDTGGEYLADQVVVLVKSERVAPFTRWANDRGFDIRALSEDAIAGATGVYIVLVIVSPGSAPDALKLIKEKQNVVAADLSYIYTTDAHVPGEQPRR